MTKEEILMLLHNIRNKPNKVKCSVCGKELEVPNMYSEKDRSKLSPFCCAATVFTVQWLVHHGWHVRNLGLHDSHPYYCNDCWVDGPEYEKKEYGASWCEQLEKLLNNK